MTGKLKSKQENRKNSFTTLLLARGHFNRLPFLSKTTIDAEQFHQVKIRALVFRRTCALGAALTGYNASKPSGNPIGKWIEKSTIPYLLFSTSSIPPRPVASGCHACRRFSCFGLPPVTCTDRYIAKQISFLSSWRSRPMGKLLPLLSHAMSLPEPSFPMVSTKSQACYVDTWFDQIISWFTKQA